MTRFFLLAITACVTLPLAASPRLDELTLPEGFEIRTVVEDLDNARQMTLDRYGNLYVGTRREGKVYAIPGALTRSPGEPVTLARGLTMPNGVAWRDDTLYVAATEQVLRLDAAHENLVSNAPFELITDDLPDHRHHGWKYIEFGPDGALYVPVGAPCNICLSEDERFASILRMDPATGATTVYAHGVRNTVGFDWHPQTGHLWFSENGRDMLGDDVPPEEINVATQAGQHFGYPFVHASGILDPEFGDDAEPDTYVEPVVEIQAHSAALGVQFYTAEHFPPEYHGALFIAEHGSWNRSSKVGYQVSVITFEDGQPSYRPFITGWLDGQSDWGRPVDVLLTPTGSLLISDDKADAIYEVRWTGPRSGRLAKTASTNFADPDTVEDNRR